MHPNIRPVQAFSSATRCFGVPYGAFVLCTSISYLPRRSNYRGKSDLLVGLGSDSSSSLGKGQCKPSYRTSKLTRSRSMAAALWLASQTSHATFPYDRPQLQLSFHRELNYWLFVPLHAFVLTLEHYRPVNELITAKSACQA
jgi:hypothetical protein